MEWELAVVINNIKCHMGDWLNDGKEEKECNMEKGNCDGLVNQIESTTAILCEDVKSVINRSVTARAWLTGFLHR